MNVTKEQLTMMGAPIFILTIISMMVLPLPPWMLDLFFTFNIAMSVVIILVAMQTKRPLEFSIFPTILLVTTLLRLALNVASTRVVLLEGHQGPDAAGKVIEAFGHFLVGGNTIIGVVVFVILVIINFMVITKGASRIAEVGARFALDAMPGKQMAIDADLSAGLIDEEQAKARRTEVAQESDFYGSMDGASKFVSGDAIAGILIMFINIIGGLLVGVVQHGMPIGLATETYTILTIGDGLVGQIPALLISVAAGMIVSRVADGKDMGDVVRQQVFEKHHALGLTAAIVGMIGMIPGMPNIVFMTFSAALTYLAWKGVKANKTNEPKTAQAKAMEVEIRAEPIEASWDDVIAVDTLSLEVGFKLIGLVDKQKDSELVKRIMGVRKKFARDVGFLVPSVHIRDNLNLRPSAYSILLKGVEMAKGELMYGKLMAIDAGDVSGKLDGIATHEPAFNLPAVWIDPDQKDYALQLSYTVVDAPAIIATHINQVILNNAAELLGREETQGLVEHVAKSAKRLVEDVTPGLISISVLNKVLKNLLQEGIPIRDMKSILEALAEHGAKTQDSIELTARVRQHISRTIINGLFPGDDEIQVCALEPSLERIFTQVLNSGGALEPGLADGFLRQAKTVSDEQERNGFPPVLLTPAHLRWMVANFVRNAVPSLKVLANSEVPENRTIRIVSMLGT